MRALKRQSIIPRLDGIARDLARLKNLAKRPQQEFDEEEATFALAQFYLRQVLEGVFHIGSHVLSRIPGGRATEYKDIARLLGERGVIPNDFAQQALVPMAGYRTRLTHFYHEVGPQEIRQMLLTRLGDIEIFLEHIRALMINPERLGLTVE